MLVYVLTAGDASSVLIPVFWALLLGAFIFIVMTAIIGGLIFWAKWHYELKPAREHLVHNLTTEEMTALQQAMKEAETETEMTRLQSVYFNVLGMDLGTIAHKLDVDKQDVEGWIRLYEEKGLDLLKNKHHRQQPATDDSAETMPGGLMPHTV